MFKQYISDPSRIIECEHIQVQEDLRYKEKTVQILAREENVLRDKIFPLSKYCGITIGWKRPYGNEKIICGKRTQNHSKFLRTKTLQRG